MYYWHSHYCRALLVVVIRKIYQEEGFLRGQRERKGRNIKKVTRFLFSSIRLPFTQQKRFFYEKTLLSVHDNKIQ